MTTMCVTSLVTASKERQTGAKSCKAGKLHSAMRSSRSHWTSVNIGLHGRRDLGDGDVDRAIRAVQRRSVARRKGNRAAWCTTRGEGEFSIRIENWNRRAALFADQVAELRAIAMDNSPALDRGWVIPKFLCCARKTALVLL
jgi:hypothetical protein